MKIAYIIYPEVIISNKSNGIRSQAVSWAEALKKYQGIEVVFINNWDDYNWTDFDVIHLFGGGGTWVEIVSSRLSKINDNIVFSPIIDPISTKNVCIERLKVLLPRMTHNIVKTQEGIVANQFKYIKRILVRSQYEANYINRVYGIAQNRMQYVPLSFTPQYEMEIGNTTKEPFCFHISSLYQERKNVIRLVKAAKKYKFELYLAGNKGTKEQFHLIENEISSSPNIHVLGFISEKEKVSLYKKAKVFALPSLQEGVGIVAVDAALMGCEIVISNIGGPKEYYNKKACIVDPYNIDDIGVNIVSLMDGMLGFQPELSEHIKGNYSPKRISELLINAYK